MTVIRPNGISGVTSITSSGDTINFYKSDGTLGPVLGLNINATTGISTFAALNVTGVLTYEDVTSVDSVGIITARSDLSIADKIIHTGDTNTAIRFPAADTITAETGGAERVRITSAGDMGLGSNSPNFSSFGSNTGGLEISDVNTNNALLVQSGANEFYFANTSSANYIWGSDAANLIIGTNAVERLQIKGTGQVLIGTTTEGHADADDLTLQAPSGYTGLTLRSATDTGGAIYFSDATSGGGEYDGQIVYSQNSRAMTFATAGVTKLTLKSDGLLVPKGIQASANVTPTSGNGVEVFAPTSSMGQIQAYDRDNSAWNDFVIKGQTIQVYANGSERLRIDSGGAVGVGIANPGDYHANARDLVLANGMTIANSTTAHMYFADSSTGTGEYVGQLNYQHANDRFQFVVGNTARALLLSSGDWATLSTAVNLDLANTQSAGINEAFIYARHSSTQITGGTLSFRVYTNGNVQNTNNSYGSTSDRNLKENIVDATSQWDDIKALQVRKYNFRENTGHQTHTQLGLIAQEVETVSPGLVETTPVKEGETVLDAGGNQLESIKSINYSVLYMKAVKALQEAQTRIETLETKVAALEG